MKRDLGLIDCARIIAALENFADEVADNDDQAAADVYSALADEIAGCDRLVIITADSVE